MPYLLARPGIAVAEAAADLGVTERQLREDLELLWVCGLPGYGPGDLIDMAFDGDRVTITYDAGIDRPLRLTPDEALALVVALRMLAETPGVAQPGRGRAGPGQDRARGRRRCAGAPVAVRLPPATPSGWPSCSGAVRAPATRCGSPTTRPPGTRPPSGSSTRCGCSWSAAGPTWRRGAAGPRRCGCSGSTGSTPSTELDEPAAPPPAGPARPTSATGVFRPAPDLPLITLRVGRGARWITEYYPCERVRRGVARSSWLVSLRASDLDWARRLVLGLGPEVSVVAPPELADAVAAEAQARAGRVRASADSG